MKTLYDRLMAASRRELAKKHGMTIEEFDKRYPLEESIKLKR